MPIPKNTMYQDQYQDYYIVMEATTPEDSKTEILKVSDSNDLHFVRFTACLQSFGARNRNGRLWTSDQIKKMAAAPHIQELISKGSFVGEAGHPLPTSDREYSMKLICSIDPLRVSHRITSLDWRGPNLLYGTVETIDDVNGPGIKMMKNIQQGINAAFSLRSLVPQRKNADGTIDVLGPGRMICYDRVYLPSHQEAYQDMEIPVKQIVSKSRFDVVMESFTDLVMGHSDKVRGVIDQLEPAMESATYDTESQMMTMRTKAGRIFVAPEMKYRREIADFMRSLH